MVRWVLKVLWRQARDEGLSERPSPEVRYPHMGVSGRNQMIFVLEHCIAMSIALQCNAM